MKKWISLLFFGAQRAARPDARRGRRSGLIGRLPLLLCLPMLLFMACAAPAAQEANTPPEETGGAVSFTDALGREVTVCDPQRVACMTGSFADIWYLAGGVERIAAAADDSWVSFDIPLPEDTAKIGTSKEVNVEKLVEANPDLILASSNLSSNRELQSLFEEMGLNAAYFDVNNFEDYLEMLALCTRLTGCSENYQTYGESVREQVENACQRADGSRPSVLYLRATAAGCKVKDNKDSVLGEMLEALDCNNIAENDSALLEELSMETILAKDPDYIFVVCFGNDEEAIEAVMEQTLLSDPAWSTLCAVQEGRFYVMDQSLYSLKPNEKWGIAYEKLADILYPA